MKTPFLITAKNRKPFVIEVNVEGIDKPNQKSAALDELPKGIKRSDVLEATCFCVDCQSTLSLELAIMADRITELSTVFPLELIMEYAPTQSEEFPLSKNWDGQQELFKAALKTLEHLEIFKMKLDAQATVNNT